MKAVVLAIPVVLACRPCTAGAPQGSAGEGRGRIEVSPFLMCEDDRGQLHLYDFMQNSFAAFDCSQARERGDYRAVWSGGSEDIRMPQNVFVEALWEPKLGYFIPWQMCHATGTEGSWCSPPFLARLYPHLKDGELKRQIARACQRASRAP